jgi:hypothetical protein
VVQKIIGKQPSSPLQNVEDGGRLIRVISGA